MSKYFVGIVGALGTALIGAWLVLAPFALGYQPEDADWIDATRVDFWTGLVVLVLSLVGVAMYATGLVEEMRARGVIERRAARQAAQEAAQSDSSLDQILAPLAAAMLEDLRQRQPRQEAASYRSDGVTIRPQEIERSVR